HHLRYFRKHRGEAHMMTILRHIATSFIFSLLLVMIVLGVTFYKFPLQEWEKLLTEEVFNIPYLGILGISIFILSTIIGITTSQYWKQRTDYIERQLDQLNNAQSLLTEVDQFQELKKIDERLKQMETKMRHQIEHAQ